MLSLRQFILFENNDFLILNKPSGIAVHSGSSLFTGYSLTRQKSLVDFLHSNKTEKKNKVFLAHRLDCETSGCILFVKSSSVFTVLHSIKNIYYCIVFGLFKKSVIINIPVKNKSLYFFLTKTIIIPVKYIRNKYTLLKIIPLTGRKHQIRTHLASLNYSIIGDDKYGNYNLNRYFYKIGLCRLFLHKSYLSFNIRNELYLFNAPYDKMFQILISL